MVGTEANDDADPWPNQPARRRWSSPAGRAEDTDSRQAPTGRPPDTGPRDRAVPAVPVGRDGGCSVSTADSEGRYSVSVACGFCGDEKAPQGIDSHERFCEENPV